MSYDAHICNKKTKKILSVKNTDIKDYGGTIAVKFNDDGSYTPLELVELRFNATYNYCNFFQYCFGKEGIRELYGKDLKDCLDIIDKGIKKITDTIPSEAFHKNYFKIEVDKIEKCKYKKLPDEKDYWSDTPMNVLKTLNHIHEIIVTALPYNKKNNLTIDGD